MDYRLHFRWGVEGLCERNDPYAFVVDNVQDGSLLENFETVPDRVGRYAFTVLALSLLDPRANLLDTPLDEFALDHRVASEQLIQTGRNGCVRAGERCQHRLEHYPIAMLLGR